MSTMRSNETTDAAPAKRPSELPRWLWLWFPPLLVIIQYAVRIFDKAIYDRFIDGELGLVELATPAVLVIGIVAGVLALRRSSGVLSLPLRIWIALVTAACVYFAGEELSWGQQLFHWATPEAIDRLNDQHETNIHNMSSWFDQKPRLLLELWVLIGGVVLPIGRLIRGRVRLPETTWQAWFWPSVVCMPAALLAILVRLPERFKSLYHLATLPLEIRYSETQEYYFAVFLMIYLLSLGARLSLRR